MGIHRLLFVLTCRTGNCLRLGEEDRPHLVVGSRHCCRRRHSTAIDDGCRPSAALRRTRRCGSVGGDHTVGTGGAAVSCRSQQPSAPSSQYAPTVFTKVCFETDWVLRTYAVMHARTNFCFFFYIDRYPEVTEGWLNMRQQLFVRIVVFSMRNQPERSRRGRIFIKCPRLVNLATLRLHQWCSQEIFTAMQLGIRLELNMTVCVVSHNHLISFPGSLILTVCLRCTYLPTYLQITTTGMYHVCTLYILHTQCALRIPVGYFLQRHVTQWYYQTSNNYRVCFSHRCSWTYA